MLLRRNVPGQTVALGPLRTTTGGVITTGVNALVNGVGGAGTPTHLANGIWQYTFSQAETNVSLVRLMLNSVNGGIAANFATLEITAEGSIARVEEVFDVSGEVRMIVDEVMPALQSVANALTLQSSAVIGFGTADGSVPKLVIGDDYLAVHGRAIDVLVDTIVGYSVSGAQCIFGGSAQHRGDWLVSGTVTAVTVDGVPKWRMRFELEQADTIDCRPGDYEWSATLLISGKRVTRVQGVVQLVNSQTIE